MRRLDARSEHVGTGSGLSLLGFPDAADRAPALRYEDGPSGGEGWPMRPRCSNVMTVVVSPEVAFTSAVRTPRLRPPSPPDGPTHPVVGAARVVPAEVIPFPWLIETAEMHSQ